MALVCSGHDISSSARVFIDCVSRIATGWFLVAPCVITETTIRSNGVGGRSDGYDKAAGVKSPTLEAS